jgi:hypothetical protein
MTAQRQTARKFSQIYTARSLLRQARDGSEVLGEKGAESSRQTTNR